MEIISQEVVELDKALGITIDEALATAMASQGPDKSISNGLYLELLNKLNPQEQESFTLSLASSGIKVVAVGMKPKNILRRIKPKKPGADTEYKKEVQEESKHPKLDKVVPMKAKTHKGSVRLNYDLCTIYPVQAGRMAHKRVSFKTYIANTDAEKTKGLQSFDALAEDEAMLFPFGEVENVQFHMGSVKFPIDIIFLLDDGENILKIGKIVHNACPGDKAHWFGSASHVLEVCGKTCNKLGLKIGSTLVVEEM